MAEEKKQEEEIKDKKAAEQPKAEEKKEIKKQNKEKPEEKHEKKTEAIVNGKDLPLSTKHCIAICNSIRGKKIDQAINLLNNVVKMKKAIPMKGELPHRKGRIMSGRYPVKACRQFIKLLRQLAANASVNEIDIDKERIECKANRANRPYRRFGNKRFKRSHVTLKLNVKKEHKQKNKKK